MYVSLIWLRNLLWPWCVTVVDPGFSVVCAYSKGEVSVRVWRSSLGTYSIYLNERQMRTSPGGTEASLSVLYRALRALMLLLLSPLMQTVKPSHATGGIGSGRVCVLWLGLQRKMIWTLLTLPQLRFQRSNYRRPSCRVGWQRLRCLARGHFCQLLFGSV